METDELKANIMSLVRLALGGLATWLIYKGVITEGQREALILGGLGAATAILNIIWAVVNNRRVKNKLETALALPAGASKQDLKAVTSEPKERKKRLKRTTNPYKGDSPKLPRKIVGSEDETPRPD